MSELPCITVYFLPTVFIDCFLYLKTEMHSYCIQSCLPVCAFESWWCAVLFRDKFPTSTYGHISTFCFCAGFTVPGHPWRPVVHCTVAETRIQAHIFCVDRYFFQHHWFTRLPVEQKACGILVTLTCHCCWSISPSAALVHWAVCLFFCHSHGVIGHMALQTHLESKLGQQNLCPVGCSVLSGALCYCGNL